MQELAEKSRRQIGWGAPLSAVVHVCVILLLLLGLPLPSPVETPQQEVDVELVPPPPPPKPQEKPPENTKRATPMLAFESAAGKKDQNVKEPQPAPAAPSEPVEAPTDKPAEPENKAAAGGKPTEAAASAPDRQSPDGLAAAEAKVADANAAAAAKPAPAPTASTAPKPEESKKPDAAKPAPRRGKLVVARELYSPGAMFDPRVMQALGRLPPRQRMKQVCMIEALEQIRRQKPGTDILVPFGASGSSYSETSLDAIGGAFRNGPNWYNIDFHCKVDTERTKVVAFSYAIGSMVPKSEWVSRQFPSD
ncbi:MAG: DUF930 domain-containing protein [Phyllobacterium sp.]|uniref:DUF930 domain-containing protein n=1 Tax=Phyllobacterium sp. TaxID=1871046 RepID=UPI0030F0ADF5